MQKRSLAAVILLPFVTLGIYSIVWFVKTKGELNEKGAEIPTAWLLIIPIVNIFWMWKYFEGAEKVTGGKVNGVLNFVLGFLISPIIPMAICQSTYNDMGEQAPAAQPQQPQEFAAAQPAEQPAAPAPEASQPPVDPQAPQV